MVAGAVLPGSEYGCPSLQRFATRMSEMCVKSETHITDHSSSQARDTHFTPDSEGRNGFQLIHYGLHLPGRIMGALHRGCTRQWGCFAANNWWKMALRTNCPRVLRGPSGMGHQNFYPQCNVTFLHSSWLVHCHFVAFSSLVFDWTPLSITEWPLTARLCTVRPCARRGTAASSSSRAPSPTCARQFCVC